jgi:hypothetical protein
MERNNPKIFQKKNHDEKYEEKKAQKCLSQKTALSSFVTKKPSRHSANFRPRVFFLPKMGIFRAKKRRHSLCFVTS